MKERLPAIFRLGRHDTAETIGMHVEEPSDVPIDRIDWMGDGASPAELQIARNRRARSRHRSAPHHPLPQLLTE